MVNIILKTNINIYNGAALKFKFHLASFKRRVRTFHMNKSICLRLDVRFCTNVKWKMQHGSARKYQKGVCACCDTLFFIDKSICFISSCYINAIHFGGVFSFRRTGSQSRLQSLCYLHANQDRECMAKVYTIYF